MSKEVKVIEPHGFCMGVSRAINLAQKTATDNPQRTYLLGEIVHNPFVNEDLTNNFGVKTVNSIDDIPDNSVMIVRAHGAPPATYEQAQSKNLTVVDATCPLVAQVHKEVKKLALDGKKIIYVASDMNHDEALGVYGEAPENITLTTLKTLSDLNIEDPQNSVVITQTTLSVVETQKGLDLLKQKYPQITIKPHVCRATTERQEAVMAGAKESDLVVIVGSTTSSNSKRLVEAAKSVGATSYIVEDEAGLNNEWIEKANNIAISSGASTPESILEKVVQKIKNLVQ